MTNWTDDRNQTQARVLLDSVSPEGVRLTTFEVTLHRFVLAELNTHRVFSRNSASSRAIPFTKTEEKVLGSPAVPVEWRERQRGMQGGDLLSDEKEEKAVREWLRARDAACLAAENLYDLGVHKSIINRLIEPFSWHNVIITATEWDGFWKQRCSPLAQPEIRVAAEAMKAAYDTSTPRELKPGQWHTPLIQPEDLPLMRQQIMMDWGGAVPSVDPHDEDLMEDALLDMRKRVSAARCARVSYLTHDGERSIEKDLELYERLATASPPHASPFEHVATPCDRGYFPRHEDGRPNWAKANHMLEHTHPGNFVGWDQMRHELWPSAYTTPEATT